MSERIAVLVGSSRFKKDFHELGEVLEKQGVLVLMMAFFQHADRVVVTPADREVLREVDRRRLALATEVWVVNKHVELCRTCGKPPQYDPFWGGFRCGVCNVRTYDPVQGPYVGEDTSLEIAHAESLGLPVHYCFPREPAARG